MEFVKLKVNNSASWVMFYKEMCPICSNIICSCTISTYILKANFIYLRHGLWTPSKEIPVTARPKIKSQSQIYRYGWSIFCLPHRPNFQMPSFTVTESADFGFIPDNSTTLMPPGSPGVSREAKLSTEFEFGSLVR